MLSDLLNTNEVKKSDSTEVEYERLETEGRSTTYCKIGESYATRDRFKVQHRESGKGAEVVRNSNITFTEDVIGLSGTVRPCKISITMTIPVGDMSSDAPAKNVLSKGISFVASTGADNLIKYDGTGNGAKCLLNGTL